MNVPVRPAKQDFAVLSTSIKGFSIYPRFYIILEKAPGSAFESSACVGCSRLTATIPPAVRKPSELEAQLQDHLQLRKVHTHVDLLQVVS